MLEKILEREREENKKEKQKRQNTEKKIFEVIQKVNKVLSHIFLFTSSKTSESYLISSLNTLYDELQEKKSLTEELSRHKLAVEVLKVHNFHTSSIQHSAR